MSRALLKTRKWFVDIADHRFGYEQNRVHIGSAPYLDRFIVYLGGPCIRLHRFWRGDDDRAVHDHPWDFWTFPLTSYLERLPGPGWDGRVVKRFRFHYRPAEFQHYVIGAVRNDKADFGAQVFYAYRDRKPFWTIVIAKHRTNKWGFWPDPNTFVPWREWN